MLPKRFWLWRGVAARFAVTDEEHVQRVRRTVAVYDRWRRPFLAFYTALAVAFVGLLVAAVLVLQGLMQLGMQGVGPGFVVGLGLGTMLGGLAFEIVYGLLTWLTPLRTERLLLRYYDAVSELAQGSRGTP